jgi:hypothetical protein
MRSIYKRVFRCMLMFAGGPFFLFGSSLFAAAQVAGNQPAVNQVPVTPVVRVNQVTVTPGSSGIEVEITTSRSVALRSQVVTGPDRLILDFPGALPGSDLHDQSINRDQVKGIRVGLFAQHPPVTRVVIDLKSAQPYRIYPSGKTVIVKLMTGEKQAAMGARAGGNIGGNINDAHVSDAHINDVSYTPPAPAKPAPVLEVEYRSGRLSILAHDVSLAQVLNEVQHKTGADIPIPSVAAQEQIVANIGLLPVRDALTALLNGSRFNFIIVGADDDPSKLKSLILTFRGGGVSQPAMMAPPPPEPAVVDAQPEPEPPQPDMQPQPEPQPQPQEGQGQQETPQPQDNPPPQ